MKLNKASGAASGLSSFGISGIVEPIAGVINGITTGVTTAAVNRNNNSAKNLQKYWDTREEIAIKDNIGFYIIISLVIVCATAIVIAKTPKSK